MTTSTDKSPAESKKYRMARLGIIVDAALGFLATVAVMERPNIEPGYFIALAACFVGISGIVSVYCHGQAGVDKAAAANESNRGLRLDS